MTSGTNMRQQRGFTLIETFIALGVLATVSVGALGALIVASKQVHDGETRQVRSLLVDASVQRWTMATKTSGSALTAGASNITSCPTNPVTLKTDCSAAAIGSAPWNTDPSTLIAGDFSTGAYFSVDGFGNVTQLSATTTPAVPPGTKCNAVPANVYCREVLVTSGTNTTWPAGTSGIVDPAATVYTVWVRVSKNGDTWKQAVSFSENFVL